MTKCIVFIGIIMTVWLMGCQSESHQRTPLNPNGDSELALLMRQMYEETMKMKEAQEKGKKYIPDFDVKKLLSAHPTEKGKNATPEYKAYAQHYISIMEEYQKVSSETIHSAYDDVVNSCKACHQALCPGPLRRIVHLE